jgi:hypothetical protein
MEAANLCAMVLPLLGSKLLITKSQHQIKDVKSKDMAFLLYAPATAG